MSTAEDLIQTQIAVASNFILQMVPFINAVKQLTRTDFNVDVPTHLGFGLSDFTSDAIDKIENRAPTRPTIPTISATLPDVPVVLFQDIDDSLLVAVRVKVLYDLENGGYGIDTGDENAMLQRTRDREAQISMELDEDIIRQHAERGFSMPQGSMMAARALAMQGASGKNSSFNRETYTKRADQYVQARRYAIKQAGTIQGIVISLVRTLYERAQVTTALFAAQVQRYRADIDGQAETIRANLSAYTAETQAFSVSVNAIGEAYRLKALEHQLNNNWNVEVVKSRLEEARLLLLADTNESNVKTEAAKFGAQVYANLVIAAIGSINSLIVQTESE